MYFPEKIEDPDNALQEKCHCTPRVHACILIVIERPLGVRGSRVRFLCGIQIFFFVPGACQLDRLLFHVSNSLMVNEDSLQLSVYSLNIWRGSRKLIDKHLSPN